MKSRPLTALCTCTLAADGPRTVIAAAITHRAQLFRAQRCYRTWRERNGAHVVLDHVDRQVRAAQADHMASYVAVLTGAWLRSDSFADTVFPIRRL